MLKFFRKKTKPPSSPSSSGASQQKVVIRQKLDNLILKSCKAASRGCNINFSINIIMVCAGIALLAYAMIYSWVHSLDIYSTGFGALGVATFVSIFFLSPQSKIAESFGDLAQIQMLYRTYIYQMALIRNRILASQKKGDLSLSELERLNKLLEKTTNNIVQTIENTLGNKAEVPQDTKDTVAKPKSQT